MGRRIKISELPIEKLEVDEIVDIAYIDTDNKTHRTSVNELFYDFAFYIYGHEETAKMKVKEYFKSIRR